MIKKLFALLISGILLICSVGCGGGELDKFVEDDGSQYEIVYYLPVGNITDVESGYGRINTALNQLLETKLPNTTVKLIPYSWYEYTGKISPVIGANAKFDICFTSPDINSYTNGVAMEAFYPITEMLPYYAPQTYAKFESNLWEQTKINGNIYAVLNNQILPRTASFGVHDNEKFNQFCEERYQSTIDTVYNSVSDPLVIIEEYLNWLSTKRAGQGAGHVGVTGYIDPATVMQTWYGMDDLGTGMSVPGVVRINAEGKPTVINQFTTTEFDNIIDTVIRWRSSGLIPNDTSDRGNNLEELDVNCASTWKPNDIRYNGASNKGQVVRVGNPNYYCSFVLGTMNAISRTSTNPGRVLKFIELMHTDIEVHNLLQYGQAGVDYNFTNPNHVDASTDITTRRIELVNGSGYTNKTLGWSLGDEFLSYVQTTQTDDQHQQEKLVNDSAYMSDVIGFLFDPTPVYSKILACQAVYSTYFDSSTGAGLGRADYNAGDRQTNLAKATEFKQKLIDAGANDIIQEKQRQLDAWWNAKQA